jgi:hypothetical protein
MARATDDIIDLVALHSEWPLRRKLAWFALYVAIFAWAGFIILPQRF